MSIRNGVITDGGGSDPVVAELVEDLANRLQAGEAIDLETVIREHPGQAERLRRLLPAVRALADFGSSGGSVPALDDDERVSGVLGDFRIIREVGRGGMGVVYEAEQRSLGRRVALKVLPFAATMDSRHLQRFHNKARAAAGLHHSNIVPVYGVGCERGVHYYAMQFIDGVPLDRLLDQLRRAAGRPAGPSGEATVAHPPPEGAEAPAGGSETALAAALSTERAGRGREYYRTVARWGVQAAEALDYAHQVGVVHRDVKPGNLLVENRGQLWVTDFGLARIQSEASLTATGDLVGTLRYMSPEQALAKRAVIDHRTDVYSLGATLYELLTLQPVFGGKDREELLRQVAFEEPVPPRRLERAVPAELETIVLRALEKTVTDRYATAGELADDLRRWLEDRPIKARRPSWLQVARRWARRHKAMVGAVAVVLLVVAVLGSGVVLWWSHRRTAAEGEARAALREADHFRQEQRWPEAISAVQRAKWVLADVGADPDLWNRVEELGKDVEMARRLQEASLLMAASREGDFNEEACCKAYGEAFTWYGLDMDRLNPQEAGERLRSSYIRQQLAAALDDWASLRLKLGQSSYRELLAVSRVVDPDPLRNQLRDFLEGRRRKALDELPGAFPIQEWPPTAAVLLARCSGRIISAEQAVAVLQTVRQRHPDDFWVNFSLGARLADLRPPRLQEALRFATVAVALRPGSAGAHLNLGYVLDKTGFTDEAMAECRRALQLDKNFAPAHDNLCKILAEKGLFDDAMAECQEAIRIKPGDALARCNLGYVLKEKGHFDEAIQAYRQAICLKREYAEAHCNLGIALEQKGRLDEAIGEYQGAIHFNRDLLEAHCNLGVAFLKKGRPDEAIAECREAIRIDPDCAGAYLNLANAFADKSALDEAITAYRKAIDRKGDLHKSYRGLGDVLFRKGERDQAIEDFREAIRIKNDYSEAHNSLGVALADKGRQYEAVAEFREAVRLKKDNAEAHYNLGKALQDKGQLDGAIAEYRQAVHIRPDFAVAHANLGIAFVAEGRFDDAIAEYREALRIRKDLPGIRGKIRMAEQQAELANRLPDLLRGKDQPKDTAERLALAHLCQLHKQLFAASAHWYGETFATQPGLADDLFSGIRYNAACAAALAGTGRGKDADGIDPKEKARVRRQALDWLRADLTAWAKLLDNEPDKAGPVVGQQLRHWLQDPDFNGVRGADALADLPEAERGDWDKLWHDVDALRRRAAGSPKKPESDGR
jgi:tetratricopeptide (TPR) repeat protein